MQATLRRILPTSTDPHQRGCLVLSLSPRLADPLRRIQDRPHTQDDERAEGHGDRLIDLRDLLSLEFQGLGYVGDLDRQLLAALRYDGPQLLPPA
jgi:hypothetical protein